MIKEKMDMKKAKGQIYNFILAHNPGTKRNTLYQLISRARKIYEFIEKVGIDKTKYIKTYSANSITELSNSKIQTIIDYFSKNPNTELLGDQDVSIIDSEEKISDNQTNASEAVSFEVSKSISPIPVSYDFNSSGYVNANDGDPNSINDDSDSDDSEEEMLDDLDDGYDEYGGYNEYDGCDRGYYYHDRRYERKTSHR
jgi:hypothetical protein